MAPNQQSEQAGHRDAAQESATLGPGLLHELRQPLMGLQAGIELLSRELGPALASSEGFQLIVVQTQRLEQLMLGFRDLFAADGLPERFALQPVVERAVGLLRFRLRRLGPRFSLRDAPADLFCKSRPGALLHALTNLLNNAIDAVEQAGGTGRIEVRVLATASGPLQVRVSDEGAGIPAELRARLFVDSFTTKGPDKGTGLGLRIAREAIQRGGGTVRLVDENDPERAPWARTEFCIEVPEGP